MARETFRKRTSTIIVATGDRTRCYRSLDEIPPDIRRKIARSTSGENCATLLIADPRGKDEILSSLRGRSAPMPEKRRPSWRLWLEIFMLGALGVSVWLLLRP